jgi:enamine deaminase RidA (YjgF/YER057c/UK114 family)
MVYTSGAIPLDPKTMTVVGDKIEEQTVRCNPSLSLSLLPLQM